MAVLGTLLSEIVALIPDDYPFKKLAKTQLDTYGKAVSLHMEIGALEDSGRDAAERLAAAGIQDRLDRMVISVRQIKKCSDEVEKIFERELATQTLSDATSLNVPDYRMDRLFTSLVETESLVDVISLHGQQLGEAVEDAQKKATDLTKNLHTGETSWKADLDEASLEKVLSTGEETLSSVNGEELMPLMKRLEEARWATNSQHVFNDVSSH